MQQTIGIVALVLIVVCVIVAEAIGASRANRRSTKGGEIDDRS